jgi:tetratricopeptide (TPR) repeat protein
VPVGLIVLVIAVVGLGLAVIWLFRRRWRRPGQTVDVSLLDGIGQPFDVDPAERDNGEHLFQQALIHQRRGDHERAIDAYLQADHLGHAAAACNLGVLLEKQGDPEAALAAYGRADQRGHSDGAFNLGALFEERGQLARAMEAYRHADELGNAPAACNLGALLAEQGDRIGAIAAFLRASQRDDAGGALNLALLLEEEGDDLGARRAYERAARLDDGAIGARAREQLKRAGKLPNRPRTSPHRGGRAGP